MAEIYRENCRENFRHHPVLVNVAMDFILKCFVDSFPLRSASLLMNIIRGLNVTREGGGEQILISEIERPSLSAAQEGHHLMNTGDCGQTRNTLRTTSAAGVCSH